MSFPNAIPSKERIYYAAQGGATVCAPNAPCRILFASEFVAAIMFALDTVEATFRSTQDPQDMTLVIVGHGNVYSMGIHLGGVLADDTFMDRYLVVLKRLLTYCIPTVAALNGCAQT
jgi:enoyl-CoA hydratase/carnithine racemase